MNRHATGPRRRALLAALALPAIGATVGTVSVAAGAGAAAGADATAEPDDDAVRRGRRLQFPRDHGAHLRTAIEWWYATGELRAAGDARFGFQITFFRHRTGLAATLPGRFAARQLLFAHAALTDLQRATHVHAQRIGRWAGDEAAQLARASVRDTDLRLGGWTLQRRDAGGGSVYDTHFEPAPGTRLALQLRATQPLLLQGAAGYSRKGPDEAQASFYLSEPQLAARGRLQRDGTKVELQGSAWLDHEWSNHLLPAQAVGWDWIGMNLDDGSALTAFQLRRADGRALWAGGSFRRAGDRARAFAADELRFTPLRAWTIPASGARYPVQWRLDSPVGSFTVHALLDAQELDSRASTGTTYWEGLSELRDATDRRLGAGYLEMTGYAGRLALG